MSDERTPSGNPPFQYPTSRLFPFDAIASQIVAALEARGWQAPGIAVEFFDVIRLGEDQVIEAADHPPVLARRVLSITGEGFKLRFGRPQNPDDPMDAAAVYVIKLGQRELALGHEGSAYLTVYRGTNWEADQLVFYRTLTATAPELELPVVVYGGSPLRLLPAPQSRGLDMSGVPGELDPAQVFEEFRAGLAGVLVRLTA